MSFDSFGFYICGLLGRVELFILFSEQTELSSSALEAWRIGVGKGAGAPGILLNAARSLFPMSIGSYSRLLSSLVHTEVRFSFIDSLRITASYDQIFFPITKWRMMDHDEYGLQSV